VGVTEPGHDIGKLGVEAIVGELVDLGPEDPKALDRIEPIPGALERQVGERAAQDSIESVDECKPLTGAE